MYNTLLINENESFINEFKRLKVWDENSGFMIAGQALNCEDALILLREKRFELVIIDSRMLIPFGIGLLQKIKDENLCPCVVLLSEYSDFLHVWEALALGAFDYLVKPVNTDALKDMLYRSAEYLKIPQNAQKGMDNDKYELSYPLLAEKQLTEMIKARYERAPYAMQVMIRNLHGIVKEDLLKTKLISGRVLANIVSAVFQKFRWLHEFYNENDFGVGDNGRMTHIDEVCLYFAEKIKEILNMLNGFLPVRAEGVIQQVCEYILRHPEKELKLTTISERFYLNHTYLSNLFRQKTGMHFNEYVTMVKMARAKFLIKYEQIRVYEICVRLGYRDNDYFNRLFKNKCGISPAKFKKEVVMS